jgi:hypothetical protein
MIPQKKMAPKSRVAERIWRVTKDNDDEAMILVKANNLKVVEA